MWGYEMWGFFMPYSLYQYTQGKKKVVPFYLMSLLQIWFKGQLQV